MEVEVESQSESELEFVAQKVELPKLKTNFESFKADLILSVQQFKIQVTEDNIQLAKNMMASLNKIKKAIKEKEKETIDFFKSPLEGFKEQIEELEAICDSSRTEISVQVKKFEDETRAECEKLIVKLINDLRGDYNIRPQFFNTNHSEFVKLTAMTSKGGLTKPTKDIIDYNIKKEQMNQILWDGRIQESFVECTKAGVEPFNESAISHILLLDQDGFRLKLKSLINGEIDRNKKIKEKAEADARKRVEEEERAKIREEERKKAKEEADRITIENESKKKAMEEQKQKETQNTTQTQKTIEKPVQLERIELPKATISNKTDNLSEPRNELLRKIYPSSMPRIFKCPNSRHAPEMNIREDFAGTNEGRAVHKFTERWLTESTDMKVIIGEVESLYSVDVAYLCWNVFKIMMKYRPHFQKIEAEKKIQANISSGFVSGFIDIIGWLSKKKAVVIDLKAGFANEKYKEQLKTYGLALFKDNPELEDIVILTIYAADSREEKLQMSRADSIEFEKEIEKVYDKDQYTVGSNCNYCPLRMECKAREVSVSNTIKTLAGTEIDIADPALYERVLLAEKAIKKYKELFKQEVELNGEIRIGVDTYYISKETKEKICLTEECLDYLYSKYNGKAHEFLRLSETELREFIVKDVENKYKSAEWRAFFDIMASKGFTYMKTAKELSKK